MVKWNNMTWFLSAHKVKYHDPTYPLKKQSWYIRIKQFYKVTSGDDKNKLRSQFNREKEVNITNSYLFSPKLAIHYSISEILQELYDDSSLMNYSAHS